MLRNYLLPCLFLFCLPAALFAADLINLNTASLAALQDLPGVGPAVAQSIIDNRPYASIEEVSRASGIGEPGSSSYEKIKDLITVGGTAQAPAQTQTETTTTQTQATQTQTVVSQGGTGPPVITAQIVADTVTAAGAGTEFAGAAFGTKAEPLAGARYLWNFGDGGTGEGANVLHTYLYPGDYDVELSVGYNYSSATARLTLTALKPRVALVLEADGSLTVADQSAQDLSIGDWALISGEKSFLIPPGTRVHARGGVRFAPAVMGFTAERGALLLFPNRQTAATSVLANDSPLYGEQVRLAVAAPQPALASAKAPAQKVATVQPVNQPAAVALAGAAQQEVAWSYLVGLAAVIALGAVGAYYAHAGSMAAVTGTVADEFDIE